MIGMKIVYLANILVAGWISISSLFFPKVAQLSVFSGNFAYSEAIRLVGALWGAIFILSILGLFFPQKMSLVLLFQLIYKSSWLLFAALPALLAQQAFPKGIHILDPLGIDDRQFSIRGYLHQTKLRAVAIFCDEFGIESNKIDVAQGITVVYKLLVSRDGKIFHGCALLKCASTRKRRSPLKILIALIPSRFKLAIIVD